MTPRQEKSSAPPQQPTGTEHAASSKAGSAPAHLRHGVKLPKAGPGQTWLNLSKKDVDNYASSHGESQSKEVRGSLLGKLYAFIKRGGGKS